MASLELSPCLAQCRGERRNDSELPCSGWEGTVLNWEEGTSQRDGGRALQWTLLHPVPIGSLLLYWGAPFCSFCVLLSLLGFSEIHPGTGGVALPIQKLRTPESLCYPEGWWPMTDSVEIWKSSFPGLYGVIYTPELPTGSGPSMQFLSFLCPASLPLLPVSPRNFALINHLQEIFILVSVSK